MQFNTFFEKKQILVTGSTSGIGLNICSTLSELNASLIITGRNLNKLESLSKQYRVNNINFSKYIHADLINHLDIERLAEDSILLDGLVLNAGVIEYSPTKLISNEKISKIFKTNFESNVLLIQNLLKRKKIKKGASIVFISSIASNLGVKGTALYSASKAALNAYAKVLANELSVQQIRVNIILPGIVKTELIDRENIATTQSLEKTENEYPFGFGLPEDITNLVLFLLSDKSRWITGSEIVIDGGHSLK